MVVRLVEHCHQWRCLTAGDEVPAAQVADHRQAGALGYLGGVAQLKGAQGAPGAVHPVVERLAVQHRQVSLPGGKFVSGRYEGIGVSTAELCVQLAQLAGAGMAGRQSRDATSMPSTGVPDMQPSTRARRGCEYATILEPAMENSNMGRRP